MISISIFDYIFNTSFRCAVPYLQDMPFISITRLRIRSFGFMPGFVLHALGSLRQVKSADGFQEGALLADRNWTFWTMTAWDSQESMRRYMTAGSHKKAMPKLMNWCDEASVVHWEHGEPALPSWTEADRRMRADGRASKVRNPSPQHATLSYRTPRLTRGGPIRKAVK
jgi:heme-degrading monooxygenase HmoA